MNRRQPEPANDSALPEMPAPAAAASPTPTVWPASGEPTWPHTEPVRLHDSLLPGFTTNLFVQAYADEAADVSPLVRHTGVGAVFTLTHRKRGWVDAADAVRHTRDATGTPNLLVDRNLYSGPKRKQAATDGLDANWVRFQQDELALAWALTDSGFHHSVADVRRTLRDARRLEGQIIVNLPMAHQLLRDNASDIADLTNAEGQRIALMLEHEADPCDEAGVLEGLAHVIGNAVQAPLLLRADTSALGAVAHGAALGAIGTHSALRHIYPVREGRGGREHVAFVIPRLLGYYLDSRFQQAYLQDPALATWRCACWFCARRDLTWISGSDPMVAAFQHSVAALADIGTTLMRGVSTTSPAAAWDQMCALAQAEHDLVSNPSGSEWKPKPALKRWRAVTPSPVLP